MRSLLGNRGTIRSRLRAASVAVVLVGAALVTAPLPAQAQVPGEVTGVAVVQGDGFATVSWTPVAGATDYQIERTPVNDANEPTGLARIVGLWQPTRTVTPEAPTFADSGFVLGQRFGWRVRARIGTTAQPFSVSVFATTRPQFGDPSVLGESLRTEFEQTNGAQFTTDVNEYAYTAALDAASDRVRVVEIGRTLLGRPINMFVLGYPTPRPAAPVISNSPALLIQCHVHGNEPSMRESCLILARELAFTKDPELLDFLSTTTVLMVPTLNGDGRAANTRGSSTGQDLNRDHSLLREPETKAFAAMLRDYTPDVAVDGHNGDSEDLPVLGPRHRNVFEGIYSEAKNGLIESWIYNNAALTGWYAGPYSNGGASQETILRNTFGLKSIVGILSENRGGAGPTRPGATTAENQHRQSYGQLWLIRKVLEYHQANLPAIQKLIADSVAFQTANEGQIVFRGSYPWPPFPPLPSAPDVDAPEPDMILDDPPCGYYLTEQQYSGAQPDGTVKLRLQLHGINVVPAPVAGRGPGYLVPMAQPLRGLIPLLLDGQAAEPMVNGARLYPPTTTTGEPLADAACGRGRVVDTAGMDVEYELDYETS
jgi:Zinc carboxypeptidase